jgi:GNAT superfamily N-acetyltransferase
MPVRLRAIDEDELPAFIVRARETYERQLVELGRLDPVEAHNKVVADSERLFPRGRPAESVRLYWIEDEGSGLRVGNLFFAPAGAAGKVAYLYGLEIDEDERGKGFGRAAMLAFEQRARELGFRSCA